MNATELLNRLCALQGILTEYEDVWGKRHEVSDESKRALLAAAGMKADTPEQAQEALEHEERRVWQRLLPPVKVVRTQTPIRLEIHLPASADGARYTWILRQEDGNTQRGEFSAHQLQKLDERELDGSRIIRRALDLPARPPLGYHDLTLRRDGLAEEATMRLIVTPERCFQPPGLEGEARVWGFGVQLYSVRTQRNWGIGDFTDLRMVIDQAADLGADIIGLNPLHALFTHNPEHASPYSPSSRLFLNVLYIDVETVPEFDECEEARNAVQQPAFQAALRALRADDLVNYKAVAERKLPLLEMLYRHFRERHLAAESERGREFRAYQQAQGESLRRYATFEALQHHFHAQDPKTWGWPVWPEEYRDPGSGAVAEFAREQAPRIEFFEYMQWLAEQQLLAAGRRSQERGLAIGMYADLAVGVDSGGAEAWSNQHYYALGARIGAPPDIFNMKGQDWGLPPLIPARLPETAYASFIATLQHTMRQGGALRIDHVMGLMRLFWVPPGKPPGEGTYVMYPFHDLLGILALESQRNRCLVIGEDLGTVPAEVRDALQPLGVLSYRLFYFEKDEKQEQYKTPAEFPRQALVAISTHDLPPLHGYWEGVDIERRWQLGLFPSEAERNQEIVARSQERARMLLALEREGLLPAGMSPDPVSVPKMTLELMLALHTYLARSASQLMLAQPEDVFAQSEQVNLPGTVDQHPNWRRKLTLTLDAWSGDERMQLLTQTLNRERGGHTRREAEPQAEPRPQLALGPPRATYRFQFHRDFTFAMATELVPYLAALGVSHCYASPYLKARPGSQHGYDIIDHNDFNPEIGSAEDFEHFVETLRRHDMSHILDMVPNHMGVMGSDNAWWLDVLENGPASAYADFFDIDWEAMHGPNRQKVLLPVLGDHYGVVLERGELQLRYDDASGSFSIHYYNHRFPIDPQEYPRILGLYSDRLKARLGADHADVLEYEGLISAFRNLPLRSETAEDRLSERQRDKELHKTHLAALGRRSADIAHLIEETVTALNGTAGEPTSFQALHQLIQAQAYRLSSWRVASDEINYRRFFDVNDLAALRMDNVKVFEQTHKLVGRLVNEGKVAGLRIDHPDGLYNPLQYFQRLHGLAARDKSPGADAPRLPYLVVEKILAHYERLPASWPVQGTTGYEFVNLLNGLFVDAEAERTLDRLYRLFVREQVDFNELLYNAKKLIMRVALASELGVLASQLSRIAQAEPRVCDFTLNNLRDALAEVAACFPVYRTYVTEAGASEDDKRYIDWAVSVAKRRSRAADISIFDFVRDILLTVAAEGRPEPFRRAVIAFAMKFQQYTGPLMAKGLEDTSFYRYNRLVSLNEVGGDPRRFAVSVTEFHRANQERLQVYPHTLLATSTHDTKRSEDVRMRIDVISEVPEEWQKHLTRWTRLNRSKKRLVEDKPAPSRNDEYLLYQTLVGAWPLGDMDEAALKAFCERVQAYMLKAIREVKVNTSWINPNKEYEDATSSFVCDLLRMSGRNPFLADFVPFVKRLTPYGLLNSLSQTLLKFTVPGVPDVYQGNELWDFSLVDPDNRRPVDYASRRKRLAQLQEDFKQAPRRGERLRQLAERIEDGDAKLFLTWRLLTLRREQPALFQQGSYQALSVEGPHAAHLCAFMRSHEGVTLVVLAPRLFARLLRDQSSLAAFNWEGTRVEMPAAAAEYRNWLSGEALKTREHDGRRWLHVQDVLAAFPVGALTAGAEIKA